MDDVWTGRIIKLALMKWGWIIGKWEWDETSRCRDGPSEKMSFEFFSSEGGKLWASCSEEEVKLCESQSESDTQNRSRLIKRLYRKNLMYITIKMDFSQQTIYWAYLLYIYCNWAIVSSPKWAKITKISWNLAVIYFPCTNIL